VQKRYNLFIDGQNVDISYIPQIMKYCADIGLEQEDARLYASPGEIARIVAKSGVLLADYDIDAVSVPCKPQKNSVDIRIAVDVIEEAVEDTDSDVVIVATNDSDFTHVASRVISYRSEFHLLHTNSAPSGYSDRVKMTRLGALSKRQQIAGQVRKVTAMLLPAKGSQNVAQPPRRSFVPDPDYGDDVPLAKLSLAGFVMRIMATSPVAIDSRCLFQSWKDHTAQAWKGRSSKKSAQQFFEERFPFGHYRFIEWNEKAVNAGYFLNVDYASIEVARGTQNSIFSLLGVKPELLARQCDIVAAALREGAYENFNVLYDSSREENVLPRYGAWAIVDAWHRSRGSSDRIPRWLDAVEQDPQCLGGALRSDVEANIRKAVEDGEIALTPRPAAEN
jgi:hypothetical protein